MFHIVFCPMSKACSIIILEPLTWSTVSTCAEWACSFCRPSEHFQKKLSWCCLYSFGHNVKSIWTTWKLWNFILNGCALSIHLSNVHAKALFCIFADEEEVWKNSCPSYWQAVTVGSYISDRKHQRQLLAIYILNTSALFIHMRYIENCRSDLTQKRLHQCLMMLMNYSIHV